MPRGGTGFRLIGQAGVYAAASQLALCGHNILFPGVDEGYDLVLGNGLKIQVKCARLIFQNTAMYREGVYAFDLRRAIYDPKTANHQSTQKFRSYQSVADFFVLWGIDEDRFWIIPTSIKNKRIYFPRRGSISKSNSYAKSYWLKISQDKTAAMEDRWDLLNVSDVKDLVNSAATEIQLAQKEN
jgi:hypothetical protein